MIKIMAVPIITWRQCASEQLPVDMVLWNPWIEKTKGLSDMADEEYVNMVCLEPGLVSLRYPFPLRAITLIQ